MGRIVAFGSLNVDLVTRVAALPRPGETVLGEGLRTFCGGKGANQAVAAARLGGIVAMVGRVGRDAHGDALLAQLRRDGVDATGVERDASAPTGAALIMVAADGENMIAVAQGANGRVGADDVRRAVDALDPGGLLVLQLEIPLEAVAGALREARRRGCRTLLNTAPAARLEPGMLRGLDVLVANQSEAGELLGRRPADAMEAVGAAQELHAAGAALAVVTLGAAGAAVCDAGGGRRVPAFPVRPVDSTAAGDAFVGALAAALAAGLRADAAVRLASAAGAAATTRQGAQDSLPRQADLRRLFGLEWPSA